MPEKVYRKTRRTSFALEDNVYRAAHLYARSRGTTASRFYAVLVEAAMRQYGFLDSGGSVRIPEEFVPFLSREDLRILRDGEPE